MFERHCSAAQETDLAARETYGVVLPDSRPPQVQGDETQLYAGALNGSMSMETIRDILWQAIRLRILLIADDVRLSLDLQHQMQAFLTLFGSPGSSVFQLSVYLRSFRSARLRDFRQLEIWSLQMQ